VDCQRSKMTYRRRWRVRFGQADLRVTLELTESRRCQGCRVQGVRRVANSATAVWPRCACRRARSPCEIDEYTSSSASTAEGLATQGQRCDATERDRTAIAIGRTDEAALKTSSSAPVLRRDIISLARTRKRSSTTDRRVAQQDRPREETSPAQMEAMWWWIPMFEYDEESKRGPPASPVHQPKTSTGVLEAIRASVCKA